VPLVDLHAHTYPLSHDSSLTPDELVESAKAAGLAGICLTEHDFFWDHGAAAELGKRHHFLVIPGIEVNTERGHMVVFGLEKFVYGMHRMHDLAAMCQAAGAAMIAAHPYRRQLPFELEKEGDWGEALQRAVANPAYTLVHAIETLNGRGTERQNAFSAAVGDHHGLPRTAGSDAHSARDVGACATEFDGRIEGLADLITALKSGSFRPVLLR
jgi:predicted metal-dependent phosphoesterase TrpH